MADKDKGGSPPEPPKKDPPLKFSTVPPDGELPQSHYSHAYDYLAKRGIKAEDCDRLGIKIMIAGQYFTKYWGSKSSGDGRLAIVFTHYTPTGEEIEWTSVRILAQKATQLSFQTGAKKKNRYCTPGELIHGWMSPATKWRNLKKGQRIYICESVIKAANVSAFGLPAVGLNGVASFASTKQKCPLISEIMWLPWKKLQLVPTILYDSDYEKPDIERAYGTLASKLVNLCQSLNPILLPLPKPPEEFEEENWGFDDARHYHGDEWAKEFLAGEGVTIAPDPVKKSIYELNEKVVFVRDVSKVLERETGTIMSGQEFMNGNYAHIKVYDDDSGKYVYTAREWLRSEHRAEVAKMDYLPGQEQIQDECWNMWKGMGCDPKEGDVAPFLDLVRNNVRKESEQEYLLDWLAYPVQNLGAKMHSCIVMQGDQGVGKTFLSQIMTRVYSQDNSCELTMEELAGGFNGDYAARQLVTVEEMFANPRDSKKIMAKLKKIITSERVRVNAKHVKAYYLTNYTNYLITTNDSDALAFEGRDRRYFVAHFNPIVDRFNDSDYWNKLGAWMDGDGPSALHHYLLNRDLSGFSHTAPAPVTEQKRVMQLDAAGGVEAYVLRLDEELPKDCCPLMSSRDLAMLYTDGDPKNIQGLSRQIAKHMKHHGYECACGGKQIRSPTGNPGRYWVIKDTDNPQWDDMAHCVQILRKHASEKSKDSNY